MEGKTKKRILIVTDYFFPHWTGISKSMWNFVLYFNKRYSLTVLTVKYEKSLKKRENLNNTEIIREDYIFPISRSKFSINIIWKFITIVKDYDVVLINSPFTNIVPITIVARLLRKKIIVFHQGDLNLRAGVLNKCIEFVFDVSCHLSFALADIVSTYTQDYGENSRVLSRYLSKFKPFLLPLFNTQTNVSKKVFEPKSKKEIAIGFAGRFVSEKGFDILFDAIPAVIKKYPHAHFYFAGETKIPYEDFFAENESKFDLVNKHITLLGVLNGEDLSAFYTSIDMFVVPSRTDCFPLTQSEASLLGTPLVVSNIPGARMLVKKTKFGVLFNTEDSKDLSEKIIYLIENMKIIKNKKNMDNVMAMLDNDKNAKEIIDIIER